MSPKLLANNPNQPLNDKKSEAFHLFHRTCKIMFFFTWLNYTLQQMNFFMSHIWLPNKLQQLKSNKIVPENSCLLFMKKKFKAFLLLLLNVLTMCFSYFEGAFK